MKRIRGVAAMLALTGAMLLAPRLEAQGPVQLGWNSALGVSCVDVGCTSVVFTLNLSGLAPFDNNGGLVPAAIHNLNSLGYVSFLSIDLASPGAVFTAAAILTGAGWFVDFSSGLSIFAADVSSPFTGAPITITATLSAPGLHTFTYSGLAYLSATAQCFDTGANVVDCPGLYRQGDFNGFTTAIPEPMSMTLLATGLVGLGLVTYRRRKKQAD